MTNHPDYIQELDSFVDCDYVWSLAQPLLTSEWLSTPDPLALHKYTDNDDYIIHVEDNDYLANIRSQLPLLKPYIKIFKSEQGIWPAHYDNWRVTAVNIPLHNTTGCETIFYTDDYTEHNTIHSSFGSAEGEWHSSEWITYIRPQETLFSHELRVPTLINTNKPHSIHKLTPDSRIIASWTYDDTYAQAREDIAKTPLLHVAKP